MSLDDAARDLAILAAAKRVRTPNRTASDGRLNAAIYGQDPLCTCGQARASILRLVAAGHLEAVPEWHGDVYRITAAGIAHLRAVQKAARKPKTSPGDAASATPPGP